MTTCDYYSPSKKKNSKTAKEGSSGSGNNSSTSTRRRRDPSNNDGDSDLDKQGKRRGKRPAREAAVSVVYTASIQQRSPKDEFQDRLTRENATSDNGKRGGKSERDSQLASQR